MKTIISFLSCAVFFVLGAILGKNWHSCNRNKYEYEIHFSNPEDAVKAYSAIARVILEYGNVTLADVYDICELPSKFTDTKYGWTDVTCIKLKKPSMFDENKSYVVSFTQKPLKLELED